MSNLTITNTFANATTADAPQVNTNFTDVKTFVDTHLIHNHDPVVLRHGVRLHKAVSSIATGTATAITWGDEREDTDAYWTSGTDIVIPSGFAGVYNITAVTIGPFTAGRAFIEIFPTITSGLVDIPTEWRNPMASAETRGEVGITTPLGVGDKFTVRVFHSTGSSVNFESFISCYRSTV